MIEHADPRPAISATDLASRYGSDAIVIARRLATTLDDVEQSAFWTRVCDLLHDEDDT